MKVLKISLFILLVTITVSCVSTVPLNQQFYSTKKVGVIYKVKPIGMSKAGGQGLLDMALTPGDRFTEALKSVEPQLKYGETVKTEISNILTSKNKTFVVIDGVDQEALVKFQKPGSEKKYANKDYRDFKKSHNVDEILLVDLTHGLLVSYYGLIELDKQGHSTISTEIIDLDDNSLLQREFIESAGALKGNWKKGENFENLKEGIQTAITKTIETLRTKF
jgi:hypothetical protein